MNAKRLLKLADFLDTLPRQKFDYSVFTRQGGKPMREALKAGKTDCGTAGCAVGWMPVVFPRAVCWLDKPTWKSDLTVALRSDHDITHMEVAEQYFGLDEREALCLFDPFNNDLSPEATPKQVARHIRKFVARKQRERAVA